MIRQQIISALAVLGLSQYAFCKEYDIPLSNFSAYLNGKNTLSADKIDTILKILTARINALKRFKIVIKLSTGDEVQAAVIAETLDKAIQRLQQQPEFLNFIGEKSILTVSGKEIEKTGINPEMFCLQKSETPNFWVVTDLRTNIVCKFRQGDFANQKNTILFDNNLSELDIAKSLREIAEYLTIYHKELI